MIGSAVGVCVGTISEELVKMALVLHIEMHMPLAPAVGLLLRTAGFSELDKRAGFCSMDSRQASDSMMPAEGIILVHDSFSKLALEFEERVEAEVDRRWHEAGELEAWATKLATVRGPSEETLAKLRLKMAETTAAEAEFRTSQGAADRRRRESQLETGAGGFAGAMPRRFAAELIVRFQILPGRRLTNVQWALSARLRQFHKNPDQRPACLRTTWPPETEELLTYVAEVGADVLAEEGASTFNH